MCADLSQRSMFQAWNLLLCCDWPIKNLNQSAGGHTNEPRTFVSKLSDHLAKRAAPDPNNAWNRNVKRPDLTSAYVIIDFGRYWARYSCFQGEKLILPNFSMSSGVATSVSFPEVQNKKETESGLAAAHKTSRDHGVTFVLQSKACSSRLNGRNQLERGRHVEASRESHTFTLRSWYDEHSH